MVYIKDIKWVKYKKYQGCRYQGTNQYSPPKPWGPWTKIVSVIARCEGNHDTVVSYDNTAMTWGFMQWTFTSGRLQKLLESFKSMSDYDFEDNHGMCTLFDVVCCRGVGGPQIFSDFGFEIKEGRFIDLQKGIALDPVKNKKRLNDICMGRAAHPKNINEQKDFAKRLAVVFADMGKDFFVSNAQIDFAKRELKQSLKVYRSALGGFVTINNLFPDSDEAWELPIAAVFFNLWQNSPKGAYRLYINVWKDAEKRGICGDYGDLVPGAEAAFFNLIWERLNRSRYANWGWNSKRYKANPKRVKPRVFRIQKAIREFYGIDLPFIR